jgi:hypothetical protein
MINQYDSQSGFFAVPNETPKKTPFYEFVKTLTPYALIILGYLGKMSRPVLYAMFVFAVIGVYYDAIAKRIKLVSTKLHNRGIVKANIKELRRLIVELGGFIDTSTNRGDNLPYIVEEIGRTNYERGARLHFPAPTIFHFQGYYLQQRIGANDLSVKQFYDAVAEFYSIISGYNSFAICPVYQVLTNDSQISSREKSLLNAFQQRWAAFLNDYLKFVKQLNGDFRSLEPLYIGISPPLPLS